MARPGHTSQNPPIGNLSRDSPPRHGGDSVADEPLANVPWRAPLLLSAEGIWAMNCMMKSPNHKSSAPTLRSGQPMPWPRLPFVASLYCFCAANMRVATLEVRGTIATLMRIDFKVRTSAAVCVLNLGELGELRHLVVARAAPAPRRRCGNGARGASRTALPLAAPVALGGGAHGVAEGRAERHVTR